MHAELIGVLAYAYADRARDAFERGNLSWTTDLRSAAGIYMLGITPDVIKWLPLTK